jgi:cytochrome c peroxidase
LRLAVGTLLLAVPLAMGGAATVSAATPEEIYNSGNFPPSVAKYESDIDSTGVLQSYLPAGGLKVLSSNPFFQSLGTNGRSCATCHQPPSGMSISLANIQARYTATGGRDPLFAPIDGATCPSNATGTGQPQSAYSLLLNQGLIRVALTVPAGAQYTISVASDPYGCNTNPIYNQTKDPATGQTLQVVSVYRRPLPAANLPFVTVSDPVPPNPAKPPVIMWDGRETTLEQQAIDATLGHAQALTAPTTAQVNAIVAFENGVFSAQVSDAVAGSMVGGGATGGAIALANTTPGQNPKTLLIFQQFNSWSGLSGGTQMQRRASIYRGQQLFNTKQFGLFNVAGINQTPNTPTPWTCSRCHSQVGEGNDPNGTLGRLGIGVGGDSQASGGPAPSQLLPIFEVTCKSPFKTQYNGTVVTTNDPGTALITGKCADVGKFKTTSMRALASRAPYFHDGTAATLTDVLNMYNRRFNIGLSSQDMQDMINFMNAL